MSYRLMRNSSYYALLPSPAPHLLERHGGSLLAYLPEPSAPHFIQTQLESHHKLFEQLRNPQQCPKHCRGILQVQILLLLLLLLLLDDARKLFSWDIPGRRTRRWKCDPELGADAGDEKGGGSEAELLGENRSRHTKGGRAQERFPHSAEGTEG